MRVVSLLMLGLTLAGSAFAQKYTTDREAAIYGGPRVAVSGWIWTDKYTYAPGETLTLRGTIKPNNDLYPYTSFLYIQNNQTGVKKYWPALTTDVTDVTGRTAAQGFTPLVLQATNVGVIVGSNGTFPALTIPNEPGMHTIVTELRDYTGTRILRSQYAKIGVVTNTVTISGDITSSRRLTNDTKWIISGIVYVKNNAVLTIDPGTFVFGAAGSTPASSLIVTRAGTIEAAGTKSRPIIMSADAKVGERTQGGNRGWGGLVMLGKAPINVGANISTGICPVTGCGNAAGEFYIEGLTTSPDAIYGGNDPTHYCGTLTYVRVEFAGAILSPNNELNSFTWGGCGTKTVAHHLQANAGADDAFEWFGGTMNASYLVGGLHRDDFLDFQLGFTGKVQNGIMFQNVDLKGNRCIEGDNSEYGNLAEPFSNPTFFNITCIGSGTAGLDEGDSPGIYLRRGSRGSFNNFVVTRFRSSGVELVDANTHTQGTNGLLTMNGILMWKNNTISAAAADTLTGNIFDPAASTTNPAAPALSLNAAEQQTLAYLQGNSARNIVIADPLLSRPFEYSDPDFVGLFSSPLFRAGWIQPPDDGFFDQSARYVGGIGEFDWTEEWTRFPIEAEIPVP